MILLQMVATARFTFIMLAYALFRISHWWVIAVSKLSFHTLFPTNSLWSVGPRCLCVVKINWPLTHEYVILSTVFIYPLPTTDAFSHLCRQFLKTLWQKKKLLIMSNFSCCHNVFNYSILEHLFIVIFHIFI